MTRTPPATRTRVAVALAALAVMLAACGTPDAPEVETADRPHPTWTRAEVMRTLDLAELGEITVAEDGTFLLGGKRLPPGLPRTLSHGRDLNLLRLDDAVLNQVPPATRDVLLHAGPEALRRHLDAAGVTMGQVRAAWARTQGRGVGRAELRRLVSHPGADPALARQLGLKGGPR
ncbi:MAG: hypothetical protein U5K81_00300 [Trueperaceae bacterium]|nr:hypothetical protein [Trueperaceae bacterium]